MAHGLQKSGPERTERRAENKGVGSQFCLHQALGNRDIISQIPACIGKSREYDDHVGLKSVCLKSYQQSHQDSLVHANHFGLLWLRKSLRPL